MESSSRAAPSLDEIGAALKRLSTGGRFRSAGVGEFYSKVSSQIPSIRLENFDVANEEGLKEPDIRPPWWDDLDEEFELDPLHWMVPIQRFRLLSPEEMRDLMKAIEAGVFATAAMNGEMQNFDLKQVNSRNLEKLIALGDAAFEKMIVHNLKLGLQIARRYARRATLEDAFGFAVFGLIQAVKKFDWRLGNQFSTYASWWIRQSISREIANSATTISLPVHAVDRANAYLRDLAQYRSGQFTRGGEVTVRNRAGDVIATFPGSDAPVFDYEIDATLSCALQAIDSSYEFWDVYFETPWLLENFEVGTSDGVEDFEILAEDLSRRLALFVVTEQELAVIHMRHGYGCASAMTLEEVGQQYGVTRERIRQIETKALKKISRFVSGLCIGNYWECIDQATADWLLAHKPERNLGQPAKSIEIPSSPPRKKRAERPNNRTSEALDKWTSLVGANAERVQHSSKIQIAQVSWALEILRETDVPPRSRMLASARIANPDKSLADLAASFQDGSITKDVVAGAMRRVIAKAAKVSGQSPPLS